MMKFMILFDSKFKFRKEKSIRMKHRKKTYLFGILLVAIITIAGIITVSTMVFLRDTVDTAGIKGKEKLKEYKKHYVLITNDLEDPLWDSVYQGAIAKGEEDGAYLEYLGRNLSDQHSVSELLRIAINAKVDGIIVVGNEDDQTVDLINEAVEKGIPVVTVLNDCSLSLRQCFVGINSYSLGQQYGEQALNLLSEGEEQNVFVLMESSSEDTSKNTTFLGIKDMLEKGKKPQSIIKIQAVAIESKIAFSSEEKIRDVIINESNLPDIMICLNAVDTRCAYQAVVDYNKVGRIQILGFYESDTILSAIDKNIIHSSITFDGMQMGALCMQALSEYTDTGYVSAYFPVDTKLITTDNVSEYLKERKE